MLELVLLDGTERSFPLPEGAELMVGVAANCAVRLTAPEVSRAHALFTCQSGRVVLLDLGSKNGTYVNGRRIKEAELHAGDFVRFASVMAQLLPTADPSRSVRERPPSGERPVVEQTAEQRQPTAEHLPVVLQESTALLLSRWANPQSPATPAFVTWLVEQRGLHGAAVLEVDRGEIAVVAAHGKVTSVFEHPRLRRLVLDPTPRAEPFETVEVDAVEIRVFVVKAPRLPWLLLVPGAGMPDSSELELFVRLLAVACRLDGLLSTPAVEQGSTRA